MSQTVCLFRKYLLARSQHNIGKADMEELEVMNKSPSSPSLPPKFNRKSLFRPPSLLERKLFPEFRYTIIWYSFLPNWFSVKPFVIFWFLCEGVIQWNQICPLLKSLQVHHNSPYFIMEGSMSTTMFLLRRWKTRSSKIERNCFAKTTKSTHQTTLKNKAYNLDFWPFGAIISGTRDYAYSWW